MPGGLLGIEPLDRVEIESILDRAKSFQPQQAAYRKSDLLRGRMIVNLFFEASTRTRTSFELSGKSTSLLQKTGAVRRIMDFHRRFPSGGFHARRLLR